MQTVQYLGLYFERCVCGFTDQSALALFTIESRITTCQAWDRVQV